MPGALYNRCSMSGRQRRRTFPITSLEEMVLKRPTNYWPPVAAAPGGPLFRHRGRRALAEGVTRQRPPRQLHLRLIAYAVNRRHHMTGQNEKPLKVSLFIADVDGSLVTEDKVLTKRAQAAVKALDAAGVAFAITSGRPPRGMAMLIEPLALRTPIAGFNGGIFIRPDMTIIEEHCLRPDVAKTALK